MVPMVEWRKKIVKGYELKGQVSPFLVLRPDSHIIIVYAMTDTTPPLLRRV